jgi:hypothetical protein
MPGGVMRVLVKGLYKAELVEFYDNDKMLTGDVNPRKEFEIMYPAQDIEARMSYLKELLKK